MKSLLLFDNLIKHLAAVIYRGLSRVLMIVISSSLSHLFQLSLIYQLFYLLTQLLFILFIFSNNSLLFLISNILLYNPLILYFLWLLPPSLSPLLPSPPTFPLLSFSSFISYSTLLSSSIF